MMMRREVGMCKLQSVLLTVEYRVPKLKSFVSFIFTQTPRSCREVQPYMMGKFCNFTCIYKKSEI